MYLYNQITTANNLQDAHEKAQVECRAASTIHLQAFLSLATNLIKVFT